MPSEYLSIDFSIRLSTLHWSKPYLWCLSFSPRIPIVSDWFVLKSVRRRSNFLFLVKLQLCLIPWSKVLSIVYTCVFQCVKLLCEVSWVFSIRSAIFGRARSSYSEIILKKYPTDDMSHTNWYISNDCIFMYLQFQILIRKFHYNQWFLLEITNKSIQCNFSWIMVL